MPPSRITVHPSVHVSPQSILPTIQNGSFPGLPSSVQEEDSEEGKNDEECDEDKIVVDHPASVINTIVVGIVVIL